MSRSVPRAGRRCTIAPISGPEDDQRQDRQVRRVDRRGSSADHEDVADGHDEQAGGDAQRVVLHAARSGCWRISEPVSGSARPMPLTVPSMTRPSNHHRARATTPPKRTKIRSLSSSNHHLCKRRRVERPQALGHALDAVALLAAPEEAEQPDAQRDAERGDRGADDDQRAVDAEQLNGSSLHARASRAAGCEHRLRATGG